MKDNTKYGVRSTYGHPGAISAAITMSLMDRNLAYFATDRNDIPKI